MHAEAETPARHPDRASSDYHCLLRTQMAGRGHGKVRSIRYGRKWWGGVAGVPQQRGSWVMMNSWFVCVFTAEYYCTMQIRNSKTNENVNA